jgi:glucosamine-6-phosphate deaminase
MLVLLHRDYDALSGAAARIIATAVRRKASFVLGLASGGTTAGMYRELVRMHREEALDFSKTVTFNLDEYIGLAPEHPRSFHNFMERNLFSGVNIPHANIHIPDGTVRAGYEEYCQSYEDAIRSAGGIDLQILGIGRDGHIGFNEPASSLGSRTRPKTLSRTTLEDNRRDFAPGEDMPDCAITMGIGTILEARRIVLLASGSAKAKAVAKAIEGPITASVSASALQLHPDVTFLLDEQAAADLTQAEYYRRVMEMTAKLTPERLW